MAWVAIFSFSSPNMLLGKIYDLHYHCDLIPVGFKEDAGRPEPSSNSRKSQHRKT
ncbi:hypothetical protein EIP91_003880 [Steccherinum ochraceum]|uniref:Uncharacterized protein n=1 Tax=Steccherinum ochraceum TaxID=92696 RepID=A0A4R0RQB3_9APHY|nr:hypothetical protein EIP91_003880 [Steccherinum ochraceum]